jgi:hypothetical protein
MSEKIINEIRERLRNTAGVKTAAYLVHTTEGTYYFAEGDPQKIAKHISDFVKYLASDSPNFAEAWSTVLADQMSVAQDASTEANSLLARMKTPS